VSQNNLRCNASSFLSTITKKKEESKARSHFHKKGSAEEDGKKSMFVISNLSRSTSW
jgi:enoyl-[acyl-carrier-protein] reductase (NADH)